MHEFISKQAFGYNSLSNLYGAKEFCVSNTIELPDREGCLQKQIQHKNQTNHYHNPMLTLGGIIQTQQKKNERTTTIMIKDTHFDPKNTS